MTVAVKICGLSEPKTLAAAIEAGAGFVGFMFFRRSPRFVTLDAAAALAADVPRDVISVGVFVDPKDKELERVLKKVPLKALQLHGKETPERAAEIQQHFGLPIIKVLGVSTQRDLMAARVYDKIADWMMFDAKAPPGATRPGGNAVAFDWTLLKTYGGRTPWLLAGGLTRGNVGAAIKASGARMVDVSSGVESAPGVKSAAKIRAFIAAVRAAE